MSMPVGGVVCCYNSVEFFTELTAVIGEGFLDPSAEYVLHGRKEPDGAGRSSAGFDTDRRDAAALAYHSVSQEDA